MSHTPGPWNYSSTTVGIYDTERVLAGKYENIAHVHKLENLRLIAAAPELLAALELANTMLNFLYKTTDDHAPDNVDHGRIRLAIAKAKGE